MKPHRVRTFKLSNDPCFSEKLTDVVGLYLNPPEKAIVLCVDEKSQIQALDRTQASLPMKKGRAGTMTHDYKRNGTTTLVRYRDVAAFRQALDCDAPFPSAFAIECEECGAELRPPEVLGVRIRRAVSSRRPSKRSASVRSRRQSGDCRCEVA